MGAHLRDTEAAQRDSYGTQCRRDRRQLPTRQALQGLPSLLSRQLRQVRTVRSTLVLVFRNIVVHLRMVRKQGPGEWYDRIGSPR